MKCHFNLWVGKIPLKEGIATHSSIFAWRIPSQTGVWWATVKKSQHAQGPGCQVLLWIREKRGGEEKRAKNYSILANVP